MQKKSFFTRKELAEIFRNLLTSKTQSEDLDKFIEMTEKKPRVRKFNLDKLQAIIDKTPLEEGQSYTNYCMLVSFQYTQEHSKKNPLNYVHLKGWAENDKIKLPITPRKRETVSLEKEEAEVTKI